MIHSIRRTAFAVAVLAGSPALFGQATNSGDIRGTATDTTGALIPGVQVTVTNLATGIVKQLTTNNDGLYDTSSIVVGTYSVSFEKDGFQTFTRTGVTVQVGLSTVNAAMKIGSTNEVVTVNTDIPLLTTETGEQSTTFDSKSMSQLPNVGGGTGPDWQNFAILIPGSSGAPGSAAGNIGPGQEVSVNGNLPYSNVLADGASTTLSHSQNSDVSIFETVAEVQVSTSAFSAQYGIGGVIFNQISKGGTNQFHGSLYDYFQSDKLNAYNYQFGLAGDLAKKNRLHYNDFGGSIGGPVLIPKLFNGRDKAFFFFDYDQIVNHGTGSTSFNSIPTAAVMGGNFTGQDLIYDPTTQTIAHDAKGNPYPVRQSFLSETGQNAIPTAMFDKVSAAFQQLYPTANNHIPQGEFVPGTVNASGVLQNNFYSSLPQSTPYRRYFGRFDYNITANNRLSMSDTQRDTPVVYPNSVTPCPIGCQSGDVDSNNAQVTDVHTFSSRTINEARFGFTHQGNFFADLTIGQNYPQQLGWQFAKANSLPAVNFNGTYPYAWIEPASNAVYKEVVFDPSDVVTLIRGKHILHFGGEFLMYEDNSTAWGNQNAGTLDFNGSYTRQWTVNPQTGVASPNSNTGTDYADFLLGDATSWGASVSPEYGGRLKSPQVFVQDDFKIKPNLTLNLGLRYQDRIGWKEIHGNEAVYDPTVTNPANNQAGAYWYGTTQANGRTQLEQNNYTTFLPRAGFSWLPHPNMTLRGGFGIYAYNLSLDTYGTGMGQLTTFSGNANDNSNGITPVVTFSGTGSNLPYTAANTNPARYNGQNVSFNLYQTPTPKIYQYNFAMQTTAGNNMVFELAYVGSHGFNLNYPTDTNVLLPNEVTSSVVRPNTLFNMINGSTDNGISNYNSLQAQVQRRLSHGLSFDFNYTWAHFLDSQDSSGEGSREGPQNQRVQNNTADNYGNSNFDIRNAFKGRLVYQLPFGKGRMFMNKNFLLDEVLGQWQASSTIQLQSGNPFTVFAGQYTYQEPGQGGFADLTGAPLNPTHRTLAQWFNPAAFSLPANGTFGTERRNQLYGPGLELVNISIGKDFQIHDQKLVQFRIDTTNAFNHFNPGQPNGTLTTPSGQGVGQAYASGSLTPITGVNGGGRTVQLSGRFQF